MNIDTRKFFTVKEGASYSLPIYKLDKDGIKEIVKVFNVDFVKGNIEGEEFRQDGIISENLISMLIFHLNSLNQGELRNKHTSLAVTKLEEALMWIEERKRDRAKRKVLGTYKK